MLFGVIIVNFVHNSLSTRAQELQELVVTIVIAAEEDLRARLLLRLGRLEDRRLRVLDLFLLNSSFLFGSSISRRSSGLLGCSSRRLLSRFSLGALGRLPLLALALLARGLLGVALVPGKVWAQHCNYNFDSVSLLAEFE